MLPVIRIIDKHFQTTLKKAERAEMAEFYDEAVELYEQLIAEGIYTQTAYERLIVIYSKTKRKKDLIRILKTGINFFETRKSSQTEYVRSLAKKYNAEDYCEMCIKTGKKIRYYCGYIVLYQDYPFIETWKKRLAKLLD
jgi:DNA-binding SARP family transcriptional activator